MIVAIEGPNLVGKTTLVRQLQDLYREKGRPCTVIPEYVDYLGDQNKQPERPLTSRVQMEQEGRFYIELEKTRQQDIAHAMIEDNGSHLVLMDRTFFTCLAYATISGNPVSERMFLEYITADEFVLPDRMLFLCIDPESDEYKRRKEQRKNRNPRCRGLSYKVQEYAYIYRNREYERYFREIVTKMFGNILFVNVLETSVEDLCALVEE